MKREQQLDQVDRLTRPMELRFAAAYRRFIARLRPTIVANVRAGRAPDAAGSKDKLPRAFASLYRRDITAGRVQADRQIPKKPARKHLPGDHDQQSHAGGTDWAWAREQHAQRIAADPEAYARAREEHEATRLGRDVATMRGGDMNRELDKLDRESAKINDRLLAAGRGNEKPSERRDKLDILSIEYRNNQDRLAQLRAEVEARYGPNAPRRLPPRVGSKPRKEFKARSRMSDLEEGASREVGVAGTRRLPYATGVTFDVGDLIDASLERLGGTLDTLDDRLEAVLSDAPDDATDDELADLMEAELDAFEDNGKIEDIAETEVFGSVNGGRAQAFEENEVEWGEWGTMQDNRVRETHVDLGESGVHPIGFNYAKLVGFGETLLRWPHDVECQEASLVCNCRCALLYAEAPANAAEIYDEEMGDLGEEEKGLLVAKHLPGEHDQQSHAGDGGGKGDEGGGGTVAGTAGSSGGSSADRIAGATARANTQIRMPEADYDKASEARTEEENRIDNEQAEHSVVLTAAVAAHADAQQAADAASAIGNRPEATDADKQAAYEGRRALGEAVIGKNNALVKQESFDAQRNELNASMGADYWATHYEKNPDEFETTMDELRGSWRHIGGMTDKVDPIAFRFASQTAFGLDQGVAFDKKADRLIDRAEYAAQEGAMTQWAGAMRNEYEDTQEELKADVEWNGGDDADQTDNYDAWTESDSYTDAYSNAKSSSFGDLKQDELEELVDNGPGEAKAYEWASENLDKLEEHGDDAEPTMQGLVFPDTGSDENPSTVEGALDKLREAGITGDYDPNQRVIEEDGQPIRQPIREAELKGVADLKALGETVDSRREEAAAMSGKAADLDAVASKEWGDNWKNALWQGKLDDQMTKPQREELMATKYEIDKLNRDANAATKDAQELANRSESMAIRIMEQTGKWPHGKTTEENQNELDAEIDTFVGKWGKLAYAKEDPKGEVMDEFSQNFEYDDSADFQDWQGSSGSGSSGEPMTIRPNDWPLEMTRNMDADESGYVSNFSESWAFGKEQRMFGSTTITRKIDKEKVLVFQGAKHWRAVGMGLTEAEFIVLSDRPWWVRQKARDEERARQQEEAQIANKSGRREKRRDAGDVLLPGERGGHRGAESDDGGREGERWRDSGGPVHREGGPEATRGGAGAGARKDAHEKGDVSKHLPGQHEQQDHAGGRGGEDAPDTSPEAGGHEYSGAYERGAVKPHEPRPEVAWSAKAPSPDEFIKAREKSKHGGFLSPLTPDELKGSELHLSKDGKVGYAISADGDFGNLFNNGGPKGAGQTAVIEAIESGKVKTADCFNGYLPELYANFGLKATSAMKFNDDYAPPGWNYKKDDRPDVLFLAFEGGDPETIRARIGTFGSFKHPKKWKEDYDAAKAESKRRAVAQGSSGKSAGGVRVRLRGGDPEPDRGSGDRVGEESGRSAQVASGVHRHAVEAVEERAALAQVKAWLLADPFRKDFNEDQARDESGRWSDSGGGGGGGTEAGGSAADEDRDAQRATAAHDRFASDYANNKEAVLAKYTAQTSKGGGFYISADEAKELSEDYSRDPDGRSEFSAAIHDTSAAIAREAYARALDAPVAPGHNREVVFTAGGPGSGKTTGIANMPAGEALLASAHAVVDSTLGGKGATKQIEQALEKGFEVSLIFTYRDPEEAFLNGVVPRANRYGRIVPVPEAVSSHAKAYERMVALTEKYKDDPRVEFTIIDNSRGRGNARVVDKLPKAGTYGKEAEDRLYRALDKLWREGKIKPAVYRAFKASAGRTSAQ